MLILCLLFLLPLSSSTQVRTSKGVFRGYTRKASDGQTISIFKAVPISSPPVGPLRFALPQPHPGWSGVRDATHYSAACMSNSSITTTRQKEMSEDCLYINLFIGEGCTPSSPCPVLTYFHGGNLNYDSAVMFNDTHLINRVASQGVIFAIPAFRLGIFGLLTLNDRRAAPSNLAFYDAIAALVWIQDEIGAFGGDPDEVTIMGHSMGGSMVMAMSLSPDLSMPGQPKRGGKLFHRVASMSGSIESANVERQKQISLAAGYYANCTSQLLSTSTLEEDRLIVSCLRTLTSTQLAHVSRRLDDDLADTAFQSYLHLPPLFYSDTISPNLRDPPQYDLLLGSTAMELGPFTKSSMLDITEGELLSIQNLDEFKEKFIIDAKNAISDFHASYISQVTFVSNYVLATSMKRRHPERKVYIYSLDTEKHNFHSSDMYYMVGVHSRELNEEEECVMEMFSRMFTEFAKTGIPASDFDPFSPFLNNYYSIQFNSTEGTVPHMENGYHQEIVDYWLTDLVQFDRNISLRKGMETEEYPIPPPSSLSLLPSGPIPVVPSSSPWIYIIVVVLIVLILVFFASCSNGAGKYTRLLDN